MREWFKCRAGFIHASLIQLVLNPSPKSSFVDSFHLHVKYLATTICHPNSPSKTTTALYAPDEPAPELIVGLMFPSWPAFSF